MQATPLEQSILHTLLYFDIANFPLTKEEIWRFLWQPPQASRNDICQVLTQSTWFEEKYGYYFLPGRSAVVEARRRAVVQTDVKLEKARRAARLISVVPFLRAVFVCNSVGREVAKPESDIDLFIITEINRLWIVRFFTNAFLRFFGLRTYGRKQRNRVCLSFFVDRAHMDLSPWRIGQDDVHFAYWILQMTPVYDPDGLYKIFVRSNHWLKQRLPNAISSSVVSTGKTSVLNLVSRRLWESMWRGAYGDLIEKQAREIQMAILSRSIKVRAELGDFGVVIQSGILKLHENDTRRSYAQAWLTKIAEVKK